MPVAVTYSSAEIGIDAPRVTVEVDVSPGLPQVLIVGMAETTVRESKDRIRAAFRSCGLKFPDKRITVNLAPADLPKTGGRYDLAIAIAILAANGEINEPSLASHEFLGELSLTGELRGVGGVLPAAVRPGGKGSSLIVPAANVDEAALSPGNNVFTSRSLMEVISYVN
ncbi:MAG: magnesium chelatase domain-containing protein, partial [Pseudohongiellaceae bacterium]